MCSLFFFLSSLRLSPYRTRTHTSARARPHSLRVCVFVARALSPCVRPHATTTQPFSVPAVRRALDNLESKGRCPFFSSSISYPFEKHLVQQQQQTCAREKNNAVSRALSRCRERRRRRGREGRKRGGRGSER